MSGYHFKRIEELHREHIEIFGDQQRPIIASYMLVIENDIEREFVSIIFVINILHILEMKIRTGFPRVFTRGFPL